MNTKALRQKILDLAIHGKLVPQDPNDEPASVLLERIRDEKERLIKEGKIKHPRRTKATSDKPHYPYELPEGWAWCKLDDLAFYKKGPFGSSLTKAMFVSKGDDTYKVYEQKNAIQKDCTLGTYYISKEKYESLSGFAIQPFDIIVSCAGTIGETYVLPRNIQKGIINQALMLIRLYYRDIEQFYLLYFDFILKEEAKNSSKGTAIKNIPPFDVLKNFYIPIPPLKEQIRILDEINKWMSFVELIETGTANLQNVLKQTKSKILDLAIHGKLVPQDPTDEPATELLKRINPNAEITSDNGHYQKLPEGWCMTNIGSLFDAVSAKRVLKSEWKDKGVPFYRAREIVQLNKEGFADKDLFISEEHFSEIKDKYGIPAYGDIMISAVGSIGYTYIVKENDVFYYKDASVLCLKNTRHWNSKFFSIWLASPFLQEQMYKNSKGTTVDTITLEKLKGYVIPFPPLNEQHRIVAKVEEIFAQLDTIEASL